MAHLRSQIRDAVATAIAAIGPTVKKSRAYAINNTGSVQYFVHTFGVERVVQRTSSQMLRELPVTIEVLAFDDVDILDDTLDAHCVAIEALISNNKLSGLVRDLTLDTTETDVDGTGEVPAGIARMTFTALYGTTEADPETVA